MAVLAKASQAGARRIQHGGRACFLTFHRVATSEWWARSPDRGFYLDLDILDATLTRLRRAGWQAVTVEEALQRLHARDRGRYINFSIDDTYRDTWEQAVPLFRRHGMPVTLYVTTGIPDGTYTLWSIGLETIIAEQNEVFLEDGAKGQAVMARSWPEKRALFARVRDAWEKADPTAAYERFCATNGYQMRQLHERHAMHWDMLATLRWDPFVEVGAHTATHPRISTLGSSEALDELAGSRMRLERRLGIKVRHFAFPFGRRGDCGPRDFALAHSAGFASAATTRKGVLRAGRGEIDPYCLPRNTLNGERQGALALQAHLTGLSGVAAKLLGRQ